MFRLVWHLDRARSETSTSSTSCLLGQTFTYSVSPPPLLHQHHVHHHHHHHDHWPPRRWQCWQCCRGASTAAEPGQLSASPLARLFLKSAPRSIVIIVLIVVLIGLHHWGQLSSSLLLCWIVGPHEMHSQGLLGVFFWPIVCFEADGETKFTLFLISLSDNIFLFFLCHHCLLFIFCN